MVEQYLEVEKESGIKWIEINEVIIQIIRAKIHKNVDDMNQCTKKFATMATTTPLGGIAKLLVELVVGKDFTPAS